MSLSALCITGNQEYILKTVLSSISLNEAILFLTLHIPQSLGVMQVCSLLPILPVTCYRLPSTYSPITCKKNAFSCSIPGISIHHPLLFFAVGIFQPSGQPSLICLRPAFLLVSTTFININILYVLPTFGPQALFLDFLISNSPPCCLSHIPRDFDVINMSSRQNMKLQIPLLDRTCYHSLFSAYTPSL